MATTRDTSLWGLACDHVGCRALVTAAAPYDELAVRRVFVRAVADGWQVGNDALPDLCPLHVEVVS